MKKLFYVLILLPLLAMQCEKDEKQNNCGDDNQQCELNKLPPITSTGQGTFACLLNGKAWLSKAGEYNILKPRYAFDADYFEGNLAIDGIRYDNDQAVDAIDLVTINYSAYDGAIIVLKKQNDGVAYYAGDSCYYGFFNSEFNGLLKIIRFDSINRIVAGTFEFTTYISKNSSEGSIENCDTIYVTDGRFDIAF